MDQTKSGTSENWPHSRYPVLNEGIENSCAPHSSLGVRHSFRGSKGIFSLVKGWRFERILFRSELRAYHFTVQ